MTCKYFTKNQISNNKYRANINVQSLSINLKEFFSLL